MTWLREAINDSKTGQASSKRIIALVAALSMSFATVILAIAAVFGQDVANALFAVTGPLALLGGANYVGGQFAERYRNEPRP